MNLPLSKWTLCVTAIALLVATACGGNDTSEDPKGNNNLGPDVGLEADTSTEGDTILIDSGPGELDVEDPNPTEPDAGEPDAGEPDTGEPDANVPDADEPDADEPDADEPDADEPEPTYPLNIPLINPSFEGVTLEEGGRAAGHDGWTRSDLYSAAGVFDTYRPAPTRLGTGDPGAVHTDGVNVLAVRPEPNSIIALNSETLVEEIRAGEVYRLRVTLLAPIDAAPPTHSAIGLYIFDPPADVPVLAGTREEDVAMHWYTTPLMGVAFGAVMELEATFTVPEQRDRWKLGARILAFNEATQNAEIFFDNVRLEKLEPTTIPEGPINLSFEEPALPDGVYIATSYGWAAQQIAFRALMNPSASMGPLPSFSDQVLELGLINGRTVRASSMPLLQAEAGKSYTIAVSAGRREGYGVPATITLEALLDYVPIGTANTVNPTSVSGLAYAGVCVTAASDGILSARISAISNADNQRIRIADLFVSEGCN